VTFSAQIVVGTVSTYRWTFGDGESANIKTPTHDYLNSGTYTATLTVKNRAGQDSQSRSVTVTCP